LQRFWFWSVRYSCTSASVPTAAILASEPDQQPSAHVALCIIEPLLFLDNLIIFFLGSTMVLSALHDTFDPLSLEDQKCHEASIQFDRSRNHLSEFWFNPASAAYIIHFVDHLEPPATPAAAPVERHIFIVPQPRARWSACPQTCPAQTGAPGSASYSVGAPEPVSKRSCSLKCVSHFLLNGTGEKWRPGTATLCFRR
jgi:hypothetical protein